MKRFDSDFWNKLGGMIGYILVGFSFVGKEILKEYYSPLIFTGIIAIFICILGFIVKEFDK